MHQRLKTFSGMSPTRLQQRVLLWPLVFEGRVLPCTDEDGTGDPWGYGRGDSWYGKGNGAAFQSHNYGSGAGVDYSHRHGDGHGHGDAGDEWGDGSTWDG